ncbi:DELLA protein [Rhynchospora pubera]|uniref:DELLA protein n=1 Tax=Rhynchospora pubera TaxID=906938 RepID=A0AAV8F9W6_9POAL|nr:DELLA protein [Rhynchospora pubera]
MGPYGSDSTTIASAACSGPEMDAILAGAGFGTRLSGPCNVTNASDYSLPFNPSDLTTWVDSMLTDLTSATTANLPPQPIHATWTNQICSPLNPIDHAASHVLMAQQRKEEEDSGIRLVHLLMTCADAVQRDNTGLAASLVDEMRVLLSRVNTLSGIGKVAGYFADALFRRIYTTEVPLSTSEYEVLYHQFYESCPYLKFAHFTANQAILEAFEGYDRVHVIDFSLMQGLQWPALIQALALRPGGPPFLRITGIGPPSPDGRDALREVGFKLAELARSVRVRFAFRGVAANRLDDVKPWMLQATQGEAVAVNSVLQLHRLLTDPATTPAPIDSVLEWIVGIRPKVVTVVEQEADHNKPTFIDRFTEALFYYSTMFDSLEGSRPQHQRQMALAEVYLQKEICNIVCCEGENRVERHEPLAQWQTRLANAGLHPVHLGSNAFRQASMLLTLFSDEGYCVEEVDGCLTLGWHSRPLISASAWRAPDADVSPDDSSVIASNSNNCNIIINSNHNNNNNSSNNVSGSDDNRISV